MPTDNPFSLKYKVMERLQLPPTASDDEYYAAINTALAAVMNVTTLPAPNYVSSLDLVRTIEQAYFGNLQPNHTFQMQYARSVADSVLNSPFFPMTASALIRCESLVILLVNPPPKPVIPQP